MKTPFSLTVLFALSASQTRGEEKESTVPRRVDPPALLEAGYKPLFDGKSLDGWRKAGGTGQFKVEDGAIVGFGKNIRGNTFLCTGKTYSDFVLVFEFQFVDPAGNSGCQFRSNQRGGNGRVFGYQCEHDNNRNRSYTAGVYDESRRGWLFPGKLSHKDAAQRFSATGREVFRWDDWNTIVIRCKGRLIQTWLNGIPRADFEDHDEEHFTAKGFIALQVHGGRSSHVRWRNLYLREL